MIFYHNPGLLEFYGALEYIHDDIISSSSTMKFYVQWIKFYVQWSCMNSSMKDGTTWNCRAKVILFPYLLVFSHIFQGCSYTYGPCFWNRWGLQGWSNLSLSSIVSTNWWWMCLISLKTTMIAFFDHRVNSQYDCFLWSSSTSYNDSPAIQFYQYCGFIYMFFNTGFLMQFEQVTVHNVERRNQSKCGTHQLSTSISIDHYFFLQMSTPSDKVWQMCDLEMSVQICLCFFFDELNCLWFPLLNTTCLCQSIICAQLANNNKLQGRE
jgi:hypothetical protein